MDLTENLNLIGYSMTENRQLKNIDEVAEFISKNGKYDDVISVFLREGSKSNILLSFPFVFVVENIILEISNMLNFLCYKTKKC